MRIFAGHHFANAAKIPSSANFQTSYRRYRSANFVTMSGNALDPNLFRIKYKKCDVLVASTLALCGALICQCELNDQSYLASNPIKRTAASINNNCAITGLPRNGVSSITTLQKELDEAKEKIRDINIFLLTSIQHQTEEKLATSPK